MSRQNWIVPSISAHIDHEEKAFVLIIKVHVHGTISTYTYIPIPAVSFPFGKAWLSNPPLFAAPVLHYHNFHNNITYS